MSIQALVLCGGKGERLRPLTETIPKPMVKIKNNTILGHVLDHILYHDIKKLIVATGYRSEKIESYLNKSYTGQDVTISDAGDVDIIERIKHALVLIQGDILLLYGDTISDVNIKDLINFHNTHNGKATITIWPLQSQFGVLEVDSTGMITSFKEKPVLDKWINIGYFYFEREVLQWVSDFDKFEDYLDYLIERKELNGYQHRGVHITVNTLKELEEAEQNIDKISRATHLNQKVVVDAR